MDNYYNDMREVPLGLAMGMAMDEKAMKHYGKLTEYEKEKLLAESRSVHSKSEMDRIVNRLGQDDSMY